MYKIFGYSERLYFLLFHILLGISSAVSPFFMVIWVWASIIIAVFKFIKLDNKNFGYTLFPLAYIGGLEVAARVANTSPFLPYEFAKYFYLIYLLSCVYKFKTYQNNIGLFLILLLLPSIYFIPLDNFVIYFVNSFLGIFLLALMSLVYSKKNIQKKVLIQALFYYLSGLITLLTIVVTKASNLDKLEYSLGANFETSGGFGSNQVSTHLGIGIFILLVTWLLKSDLFKQKFITLFLFLAFLFRGILTFSRGGILSPIFTILITYFMSNSKVGLKKLNILFLIFSSSLIGVVFLYADGITDGLLSKRYQGHTSGTLSGDRELDLNVITSRRSSLMETEFQIFLDNPVLGVGPGGGYVERENLIGISIASHTEVTRLLSEHGLLGLFVTIVFLFYPLFYISSIDNGFSRFLSSSFFVIAILTSFHAAMRTTVTPFFWGVACIRFR
jgi:hypothetical protein